MTANPSPRVAALMEKMRSNRARLIFALDATASREPTWDMAAQLQAAMFEEAAKIGGLDVQLVYFRGTNEVKSTPWLSDAHELVRMMGKIRCEAGTTKIARVLRHIQTENERQRVGAAIFIGDACEEFQGDLYEAARDLNVPVFVFQEGSQLAQYFYPDGGATPMNDTVTVERVFREIARLSGGAYGKFDAGAAKQLGELLRAVAAFAAGGMTALANQNTDSARKLLGQMK
jgi:hypothetical protein